MNEESHVNQQRLVPGTSRIQVRSEQATQQGGHLEEYGADLFIYVFIYLKSRDSIVGIATGYELDDQEVGVRVPVGTRIFIFLHVVQTGSGVHPTTYPMGTVGSFPGGKAAGV
jgi:hypothetical protein